MAVQLADIEWQWISTSTQGYSALIEALDCYQNTIYPPECNSLDSMDVLSQSHVKILGALHQTQLVGTCAVKVLAGYGELKRMYVLPEYRGLGISKGLVVALEQELVRQGVACVKLETGIYQQEALALYRKLGYQTCGIFGDYQPNPYSVYFTKTL